MSYYALGDDNPASGRSPNREVAVITTMLPSQIQAGPSLDGMWALACWAWGRRIANDVSSGHFFIGPKGDKNIPGGFKVTNKHDPLSRFWARIIPPFVFGIHPLSLYCSLAKDYSGVPDPLCSTT